MCNVCVHVHWQMSIGLSDGGGGHFALFQSFFSSEYEMTAKMS